jgi:hypothetical protein
VAAVKACGCELLELLMESVEPTEQSPTLFSTLVDPLLDGLERVFKQNDSVLQVDILNLVRIVQTRSVERSLAYAKNCVRIVRSAGFIEILKRGLSSPLSFVRSHYISYVTGSLSTFAIFLGDSFESLHCQLLSTVCRTLGLCSEVVSAAPDCISSQNDVMQLLACAKSLIQFCFQDIESALSQPSAVDWQQLLDIHLQKNSPTAILSLRQSILGSLGGLMINCQKLWKPRVWGEGKGEDSRLCYRGIDPLGPTSSVPVAAREELNLTVYQQAILSIIQPLLLDPTRNTDWIIIV